MEFKSERRERAAKRAREKKGFSGGKPLPKQSKEESLKWDILLNPAFSQVRLGHHSDWVARVLANRLLAVRGGKEITVTFKFLVMKKVTLRARVWQGNLHMDVHL